MTQLQPHLSRHKTSPSLYNTEDFTAEYQFSVLQPIKCLLKSGNGKGEWKTRTRVSGRRGRGRDKEEKYTPADMHRAFLACFWALFPSLNARKKLSALIQTPPSFSPPGSWSGPRGK